MKKEYYAGLDIGGTSGRIRLAGTDGNILAEHTSPGCSINTDGAEKSRLRYRDMVLPVLAEQHLEPADCLGICVAASGIDSPSLEGACRAAFEEMGFLAERLLVVNDCQVFLYLTDRPSIVVISGTGSICFGRDHERHVYRTGGWNHILSDEGSAFSMGLKTLKAAADSIDGRLSCPVLERLVREETGLDTLEQINDFINSCLFEKADMAKLSVTAGKAAGLKDPEALRIHQACAGEIAGLVFDTYRKMAHGPEISVWLWGSVLVKNDLIREEVSRQVREFLPDCRIGTPPVTALDAAVMAAREAFQLLQSV